MEKETLKSKFLGSLIGTAVGDSVGASLEGWHRFPPEEIYALAEKRELLVYTDDTHMAIGIAESLIHNKGFDGQHMAKTFIQNFEREPFRGPITRHWAIGNRISRRAVYALVQLFPG